MLTSLGVIALAYLIGSIPWSFLVARHFGVADVRSVGSGNVGATNVLRSAGPGAAAVALVLDIAKGALAVALAGRIAPGHPWLPPVAAPVAVLGHMFPVWLGFRGGKGVATGLGAFAVLEPLAALLALPIFGLTLAASQIASLGSLVAAASLAFLTLVFRGNDAVTLSAVLTAALILARHRSNLERIRAGTERRFGSRREPGA